METGAKERTTAPAPPECVVVLREVQKGALYELRHDDQLHPRRRYLPSGNYELYEVRTIPPAPAPPTPQPNEWFCEGCKSVVPSHAVGSNTEARLQHLNAANAHCGPIRLRAVVPAPEGSPAPADHIEQILDEIVMDVDQAIRSRLRPELERVRAEDRSVPTLLEKLQEEMASYARMPSTDSAPAWLVHKWWTSLRAAVGAAPEKK